MSPPLEPSESSSNFVSLLTEHQSDIFAYLISLMPGDPNLADVLQKTNLILWRKQSQFLPGSNFRAWAFQVARYEMLHHLRDSKREGWVPIDEELADTISQEFPSSLPRSQERLMALERCLQKLKPQDRRLIEFRYRAGAHLEQFAVETGRSVSSLSVTLFRLRNALRQCVEKQLPAEGGIA